MSALVKSLLVPCLGLGLSLLASSCSQAPAAISTKSQPVLSFREMEHDFGKIQDGDTVFHVFNFTNTGTAALVISDISVSCGCTVADWPRQPIMAHHTGQIKLRFSKRHDPGLHQKTAIIKANTQNPYTVLRIKAEVAG